jgi:hypothetical protein
LLVQQGHEFGPQLSGREVFRHDVLTMGAAKCGARFRSMVTLVLLHQRARAHDDGNQLLNGVAQRFRLHPFLLYGAPLVPLGVCSFLFHVSRAAAVIEFSRPRTRSTRCSPG